MKKITNKFEPRECLYRLGKTNYVSKPTKTKVKYYIEENGTYVGILKRDFNVLPLIAVLLVVFDIFLSLNTETPNIKVRYNDTMYLRSNVLSLDLQNDSVYDVKYSVTLNEDIISSGVVLAGGSMSNVDCNYETIVGNYSATLNVEYDGNKESKHILIVVE